MQGRHSRRPVCPRLCASALALALSCVLIPAAAPAQTVRPAVVEHRQQARSRFEILNETLYPLSVIVEPRGFRVAPNGELTYVPLDSSIHLKLSAMSFRIPPRQSYAVFYEASADTLPAWFVITCTLSGAKTESGLNVQVELPHVVYLLQNQPLRKSEVAIRAFEVDTAGKRVVAEVVNSGASLGRALETEVSAGRKMRRSGGSFALFPYSYRRIEVPWDAAQLPEKLVVRFAGFAVEEEHRTSLAQNR